MDTSDWISSGAAFLSVVALAISLFEVMTNKPRLRITANYAFVDKSSERLLAIVIVNYGRHPTMISHVSIVTKGRKTTIAATGGTTLPHLLEVGRVATFVVPCDTSISDPFITGTSETLGQLLAHGKSRIQVRDAWHAKPHLVRVK